MTRATMDLGLWVKLLVSVLALVCFFLQMKPIFQQYVNEETTTGVHYNYRYLHGDSSHLLFRLFKVSDNLSVASSPVNVKKYVLNVV